MKTSRLPGSAQEICPATGGDSTTITRGAPADHLPARIDIDACVAQLGEVASPG